MAKPRLEPRQQRSRETYDRILTVAADIFAELGYAGTTTNKVAEAAGISIGTLYHYFPHKDALLYALAECHLSNGTTLIGVAFRRLRETQPGLEESLRIIIEVIVRIHVDEFHLHHLLYDSAPRSAALQKRLHDANGIIAKEVAWQLQRLDLAKGQRELTATLIVAGVEAQVHQAIVDTALHGDEQVDPDVLIEVLTQLWNRALANS